MSSNRKHIQIHEQPGQELGSDDDPRRAAAAAAAGSISDDGTKATKAAGGGVPTGGGTSRGGEGTASARRRGKEEGSYGDVGDGPSPRPEVASAAGDAEALPPGLVVADGGVVKPTDAPVSALTLPIVGQGDHRMSDRDGDGDGDGGTSRISRTRSRTASAGTVPGAVAVPGPAGTVLSRFATAAAGRRSREATAAERRSGGDVETANIGDGGGTVAIPHAFVVEEGNDDNDIPRATVVEPFRCCGFVIPRSLFRILAAVALMAIVAAVVLGVLMGTRGSDARGAGADEVLVPPSREPTVPPTAPVTTEGQLPTVGPSEPPTTPTNPSTIPPTEPPTDQPTDPPSDPPAYPPTDPPTDPPTEPPTDPPTEPPSACIPEGMKVQPDGNDGANFGPSVAISGDTVVIGSPYDDSVDVNSESALVFVRSSSIDIEGGGEEVQAWQRQAKLVPNDGAEVRRGFGSSVDVDGYWVVVGAPEDDENGENSGSAYVFARSVGETAGTWIQVAKLAPVEAFAGDEFGSSVAIDSDTIVVGARYRGDEWSGSAYVFVRDKANEEDSDDVGTKWVQRAELAPSVGEGEWGTFGWSVAINGDTIVVGAPQDNEGSAYVYARGDGVDSGAWVRQSKLRPVPDDGDIDDGFFGEAVAIDGDTVVVGASSDANVGFNSGSAFVFVRRRSEKGTAYWEQQAQIVPDDEADEDYFGRSVSVHGDTILVGSPYDDDLGSDSGSSYIFERTDGTWAQRAKLLPSNGDPSYDRFGRFGFSVAVDGETAVIGTSGGNYAQIADLCTAE